jgi:hypothetical protein
VDGNGVDDAIIQCGRVAVSEWMNCRLRPASGGYDDWLNVCHLGVYECSAGGIMFFKKLIFMIKSKRQILGGICRGSEM